MVATVQIIETNGAPGDETTTDKTNAEVRFKNADNADVDLKDALVVPEEGSTFSFEKWLRANVVVAPDQQISNLVFYTDGTNSFGASVKVWARTAEAYAQPQKPTSSDGYTDAFSYTKDSPLLLGTGPFNGVGGIGQYLVLAAEVLAGAQSGLRNPEGVIFAWDEI